MVTTNLLTGLQLQGPVLDNPIKSHKKQQCLASTAGDIQAGG
jgi:hypothetical protein